MRRILLSGVLLAAPALAAPFQEHAVSVGTQMDRLELSSGPTLGMQDVSFGYGFQVGRSWSLLGSVDVGVPVRGVSAENRGGLRVDYDRTMSADIFLGAGHAWHRDNGVMWTVGVGPHVRYLQLGSSTLRPLTHIAVGAAAVGRVSVPLRDKGWTMGGELQLHADPVDVLHGGDLQVGWGFRPSIRFGKRFGGAK